MSEKVTIYTLAEELGVSPSAVSRAFKPNSRLSPEKREIILTAAKSRGFSPNRAAARLSRREINIGAIIVNRIPDFYRAMYDGIDAAAKELATHKVTADICMLSPSDDIVSVLFHKLDEFCERRYDGIIIHGIYNRDVVERINAIVDAGTPVVTLHNDLEASRRLFNSTCNTAMAGAMAAELLRAFIHGTRKNVVIFTGSMSSPIHQQLFLSFSAACIREGLSLVRNCDTMDVPAYAARMVEEVFQRNPEIDGIYISSANSIPVCEYLETSDLAGKVALVTSDVFPRLNEYIRRGVVQATIYQDPYRQGKNAFVNLYRYISEGVAPPQIIRSNPQIVIRSNVELFEQY